jgi:dUTP pyrophosphatase
MLFKTKYVLSARCKSGRALKEGFMLTNGEGTIDEDYRGEIQCIVTNSGSDDIVIERGQKIFQGIVQKLPWVDISEVNKLDLTERGNGGFGSTGL